MRRRREFPWREGETESILLNKANKTVWRDAWQFHDNFLKSAFVTIYSIS